MADPFRGEAGGIAGLRRILDEFGAEVEADLHRFYGVRLGKALYSAEAVERYSARELLVRIQALPAESALRRRQAGPNAEWDLQSLLLRRIDHSLQGANWQRGGGKGRKPKPVDLPGTKPKQPVKASSGDIAQRLQNLGLIPVQDAKNDE